MITSNKIIDYVTLVILTRGCCKMNRVRSSLSSSPFLGGGALFCTRLRVPPLARWTVREHVRTSGHFCM